MSCLRRAAFVVLTLALLSCAITWAPGPAAAERSDATAPQGAQGKGGHANGGGKGPGGGNDGIADTSGQVGAGGKEAPGGTSNPLSFSNPLCKRLGGKLRERCRYGQGPESLIPTPNYGLDIYADDSGSGADAIVGNFQKMLAAIANAIWMVMLLALKGVFAFLGWAFSLAPFSSERATSQVDSGLENFYENFTSPWLTFGFVCLGAWALFRGVARREVGQTVGGLLLSVVLMLVALWIMHEPRDTVGRASNLVDKASLSVIAAPQSGSLANPVAEYGQATSRAWSVMTTAPWTALQFSDTDWALRPPDPELKDYMWDDTERYCTDAQFDGSQERCNTFRVLAGEPDSNVELLLASSPGSHSRSDEMWNEGFGDDHPGVIAKMSPQSGGGAWLRLPTVGLFAIGLLGALLLFMWLAVRLFVQTAVAFVLVLSTPIALFFPVFGEKGRAAFKFWAGTLLGAIVAKLVYAALLAIVLFGTKVIFGMVGSSNAGISVMMGFLLAAGFWWAIFLKRQEIAGFFSLAEKGEGGSGTLGKLGGAYAAYRLGHALVNRAGAKRGGRSHGGAGAFGAAAVGGGDARDAPRTTTEAQADSQLAERARERLEGEYQQAQEAIASAGAQAARRQELSREAGRAAVEEKHWRAVAAEAKDQAKRTQAELKAEQARFRADGMNAEAARIEAEARREAPRVGEAEAFVERAERNERVSGQRFSDDDIAQSREAIRQNLDAKPVGAGAHAHYVGMSPNEYGSLQGREREEARRTVAKRIKEDKAAFGVIPDRPGGAIKSGAPARRYKRARTESVGSRAFSEERRAQRRLHGARQMRARRRQQRTRARRRGVSR